MTIELISANTGIPMGKAKPGGGGDVDETGLYRYMGSVATYDDLLDLDTTDFKPGYVYDVQEDGMDYSWTGTTWNALGTHTDLSNYYTKQEVYTKVEVNAALTKKQNDLTKGTGIEIDAVYANQVDLDVPTPYIVTNSDRDLVPVINTLDNTQRVSIRFHCNVADARTPHFFVGSVEMGPFLKGFGVDYVYNDDSKFVVRMFYGTYPNYIYNQGVSVELNKSDYPNGIWVRMIPAETAETWEVSYSSDNKIWTVAGTSGLSSDYLTNIYYNIWDGTVDAPGIIDTLIVQYGAPSDDMITTIYTNEDHIEAHKAYLSKGDVLTDPKGVADVKSYAHSTFDSAKFTVTGSPTITSDGVASGFSNDDYIAISNSVTLTASTFFTIHLVFTTPSAWGTSGGRFWSHGSQNYIGHTTGGKLSGYFLGQQAINNSGSSLQLKLSTKYEAFFMNTAIGFLVRFREFGTTDWISSNPVSVSGTGITSSYQFIGKEVGGGYAFLGSIDLKYFEFILEGTPTFQGTITGTDTYTIGGSTVTIPYSLAANGSKVVGSQYRTAVGNVYANKGWAPYFTIGEQSDDFTLPCGNLYGYVTYLLSEVTDLKTRLTSVESRLASMESNINAGGASTPSLLMGTRSIPVTMSYPDVDQDATESQEGGEER